MTNKALTRRDFLGAAGLGAFGLTLASVSGARSRLSGKPRELPVYVGTYTTGKKSEGIYLYRLNLETGALKHAGTTKGVVDPSYLALDGRRRFLYAVNEVDEFAGKRSGALSAFSVDRRTGALQFLNQQPSHGGSPCYVTVDATDKFVLAANYVGGNVSVFPVLEDGRLGEATDVKQYEGSGPNRERQEAPHAHCVLLDPKNRHAYVCDLGTDHVMLYRFDAARGLLIPNEPAFVSLRPGAGPRQLTFHPRAPYAYVINELDWTVTAFAHDPSTGALTEIQTIAAFTGGSPATDTSADIHVTPDGKFVYASTRGPDTLTAFSIDLRTGRLSLIEQKPTGGKAPRNFAIDPTGNFLLAANQKSDSIVTFRIDRRTGRLDPTGHVAEVPSPVCLKVLDGFA